jgi:hypothetical protein
VDFSESLNPALMGSNCFEQGLGLILVVPESGLGGLSFQLVYFTLARFQVKETSEAFRGALAVFSSLGGHQQSMAFTSLRR